MAIRDLPVKYVWVHRGGKTFVQRYHTLPSSVGAEYRPDLSSEFERFVLNSHQKNSDSWDWDQVEFASEMPARIYPLSAMHDPKQVISLTQRVSGAEYCMFPTRLFRDERFLKTTKYLPGLSNFVAGVYTYGTPEEAYDAIYTVGQHLLQSGKMMLEAQNLWAAIALTRDNLYALRDKLSWKPIRLYGLSYYNHSTFSTESSFMYGVYVKLDYLRALRYVRDWLPLLTEITARQLARQIVRGYDAEQKSQPVDWGAFDIFKANESNKYAQLGVATHIAYALCIPAVESRMREVLESLNKPEIVDYYDKTVAPACRSLNGWKPDAGELYDKVLSYGDS